MSSWNKSSSAALRCLFVSILLCSVALRAQDDDFKWQDAAKEVEDLPYSRAFIDSVKDHHLEKKTNYSLRQVKAGSFAKGETLVYEIVWGVFKAGYVVLSTEPHPQTGTIRIGAKAVSNNFVSAFYKMRDHIISWVDADGLYPHFFEQHLREGKYKMDGYILYDNNAEKVFVQERKFRTFQAPPFTHDYLSILYYVRSMDLSKGGSFSVNMFIHSKIHPIQFRVKERKTLQVEAGSFDCIMVEPRLVGDGKTFNKKDKMEVWFTADEEKIPVLIKSKIKVGSITAKLIHYERN